ncbi:hypothetical protein OG809_18760 [Kribbella soli]
MIAGLGEQLLGEAGVGDDADRVGAAVLHLAGVAEGLEGFGDRGDGRVVADHRAGRSLHVDGLVAVHIAAADEDAAFARCLGGLVAGQVGVGVEFGGADDLVEAVRGDGVDQRCDALVDVPGGVLGQLHTQRGELTRLPGRGVAGLDAGPGEREPVPQRQRLAEELACHHRRDPEHHTELGDGELGDLRAAVTAQHHGAFPPVGGPAAGPDAADRRVEPVGIDLGVLQQPRVGPVGHRAVLGGRLQQVGRRELIQIGVEHAFDSICSRLACQISRTDETPYLQDEHARFPPLRQVLRRRSAASVGPVAELL